jgi:hypothetical protein
MSEFLQKCWAEAIKSGKKAVFEIKMRMNVALAAIDPPGSKEKKFVSKQ